MRNSVDFPEPEGPKRAVMVLGSRDKSVGAITWICRPSGWRNDFSTCTASAIGSTARTGSAGTRQHLRQNLHHASKAEYSPESSSITRCQASPGNSSRNSIRSSGFILSMIARKCSTDRVCRKT